MRVLLGGVLLLASCPSPRPVPASNAAPVASAPREEAPTATPPATATAPPPTPTIETTSAPPVTVSEPVPAASEPTPPGFAPPAPVTSSIDTKVAALRHRFRSCYPKGLTADQASDGTVKLELTYDANGKMTSAKVLCTKLSKATTECIRKVFLDVTLDGGPGKLVTGGPC